MFERINGKNILFSAGLGILIGLVSRLLVGGTWNVENLLISTLVSGAAGFLIGALTEWILTLLPVRHAKLRTYFLVNIFLALLITGAILTSAFLFVLKDLTATDTIKIIGVAFILIILANFFEYSRYKKANKRLNAFQKKSPDDS